jgi:anti-sigma regulatory factor (Ser/Thr protein kinase)/Na+-translocating ferredoxin:NAD+ oxidoreductase RNF subunit RnfB
MTAVHRIVGGDFEHGGSASRAVKEELKQIGADPAVVRRAMIAAYEAEMNVVIHAHGGELRASLDNGQLDVEVLDTGPGIPDVAAAMREGFSTASAQARELGFGAGMGLPNIKRNADTFEIESGAGRGTRVRFTIALRPRALYGCGRHSIRILGAQCRQSLRCVRVCPTQALRVFRGKPEILDYLCVDCGACVAECPTGAMGMQGAEGRAGAEVAVLSADVVVLPAAVLAQYGAGHAAERVIGELTEATGGGVRVLEDWEGALRSAVADYAAQAANGSSTDGRRDGGLSRPVISPACPAVVNLVETRFPSLIPHLAPFVSAVEAAWAELGAAAECQQAVSVVVTCPAQRTALLGERAGLAARVVSPGAVRAWLMPRLAHGGAGTGAEAPDIGGQGCTRERTPAGTRCEKGVSHRRIPQGTDLLRVSGLRHVVQVLNAIEDGLVTDVDIVEPWVCEQGCWGSPLLVENPFLAQRRWNAEPLPGGRLWGRDGSANRLRGAGASPARAVRRTRPFSARQGLRLDEDMGKAIQKLARIDKLRRGLPGSDCGMCGAPTCAALAEDIVLGRAAADACVRQQSPSTGPGDRENKA